MYVRGPSNNQVPQQVNQSGTERSREVARTRAPGAVDSFDESTVKRTDAATPTEKKGFFARLFEAIGNFFAKIFSFFSGKGTTSEESSNAATRRTTVSRNDARATTPTESLRPDTTTSATRRNSPVGSSNWRPDLAGLDNTRVQTRLPTDNPNIHHYTTAGASWGTERTIGMLEAVAAEYRAQTGYVLRVGDISKRGGGQLGRHESHKHGRNIDIDLAFNDGRTTAEPDRGSTNATFRSPAYDRDATRRLIRLIKQCNPSAEILFNDPVLVAEGLVTAHRLHDNHLHVQGLS